MRRLLMFLVEKLTKDITSSSTGADQANKSSSKSKNINFLISQQLKKFLSQIWIPPYCKLNGLRLNDDSTYSKEGCKFINEYRTLSLGLPHNYLSSKNKNSKGKKVLKNLE
jgi:hypothetical protein